MEPIFNHKSIRKYKSTPIQEALLKEILEGGTRASNTGNIQAYSIIVTTDEKIRKELLPCHFGQQMVVQAPVVLTFCADISRFSQWCRQRGAEPEYDNFIWFVNGAIDAVLASQNVAIMAEANGLGICYLGTTVYTADKICDVLDIPQGVIPVTTIVMGYPDEEPGLTDRLPLEAVVHNQKYHEYSEDEIDKLWSEKEASAETKRLLEINDLPNLARIFTEKRYTGKDNVIFSEKYMEALRKQGFLK